jgi:formyltetrahydrofolate deformylase
VSDASLPAHAVLLLSCPDQPGIVAAVADAVYRLGGNIVDAEQHTDRADGVFFQRVEFELAGISLPRAKLPAALQPVIERFAMRAEVRYRDERPRMALLVSRQAHCLYDLLTRWRTGELAADIAVVVSNHPDHADVAAWFGVPFHHLPVTPDTKREQEGALAQVLAAERIDVVVLARYMQILSADLVAQWPDRIINIHHSFLPAFVGARPYHQAHDRGVKIIGVTAHYATAELDQGPIIEQDVVRVTHRDSVDELVRKGRDLEVTVLARAVRAHIEHRVLVYGRRTVVFS